MRPMTFTMLVDDREKKPLPFRDRYLILDRSRPPSDQASRIAHMRVEHRRLPEADYCLADEGGVCYTSADGAACAVAETKRSASEIANNCLNARPRASFIALLQRLRARYGRPLLLLEGSPSRFLAPSRDVPQPGLALDALFDLSNEYGVPVQLYGGETTAGRWLAGEYVARFLISGVLSHAGHHHGLH